MDTASPSASSLGIMVEITPSSRFVEAVAEKVKADVSVTSGLSPEDVIKLRDSVGIDNISNAVCDSISAGDVAEYMDSSSVAEELSQHLDYYEITSNLDIGDIAEYVCVSDVADCIDVSSVAEHIEVDEDAILEELDYKKLARALLEELTRLARVKLEADLAEAKAKETQPA